MNSYDNAVALIIGLIIVACLVYALLFPEKL